MYLAVEKVKGYELKLHDVIRLGSVNFFVKEMSCNQSQEERKEEGQLANSVNAKQFDPRFRECNLMAILQTEEEVKSYEKKEGKVSCMYCLESTASPENPLIITCKCIGADKFVHIECL